LVSCFVKGHITLVTPEDWSCLYKPGHAVYNYGQDHEFANARAN